MRRRSRDFRPKKKKKERKQKYWRGMSYWCLGLYNSAIFGNGVGVRLGLDIFTRYDEMMHNVE